MEKTLIFDIDDTIIATYENAYYKSTLTANYLGLNIPSKELFFSVYGKISFEECINIFHPSISIEEYKHTYNIFREKVPYREISNTYYIIKLFIENNFKIGILTNGPKEKTHLKLNTANIKGKIKEELICLLYEENLEYKKPDPRCFNKIIESNPDLSKDNIYYIGDSINDFLAANNYGINFIGVLSGITSKNDFLKAGLKENNIINNIEELKEYFNIKL